MPFIAALLGAVGPFLVSWAGDLLIAFGVSFVTYKGVTAGLDSLKASVLASTQGLPADTINLIAYLWLDKALTLIMSAMAASIAFRLSTGAFKKVALK
jgi:hypothetical protein